MHALADIHHRGGDWNGQHGWWSAGVNFWLKRTSSWVGYFEIEIALIAWEEWVGWDQVSYRTRSNPMYSYSHRLTDTASSATCLTSFQCDAFFSAYPALSFSESSLTLQSGDPILASGFGAFS